jgi:hypothetical protein
MVNVDSTRRALRTGERGGARQASREYHGTQAPQEFTAFHDAVIQWQRSRVSFCH